MDNRINRLLIERVMTKSGFSADIVEDAGKVVKIIKRESEGIDVMDLQMPEIDGYEAMRETLVPNKIKQPKTLLSPKTFSRTMSAAHFATEQTEFYQGQ